MSKRIIRLFVYEWMTIIDFLAYSIEGIIYSAFTCTILKPKKNAKFSMIIWVLVVDLVTLAVYELPNANIIVMWLKRGMALHMAILLMIQLLFVGTVGRKLIHYVCISLASLSVEVVLVLASYFVEGNWEIYQQDEMRFTFRLILPILLSISTIIASMIYNKKYRWKELLLMISVQLLLFFCEASFALILYYSHSEYIINHQVMLMLVFVMPALMLNYLSSWTTMHIVNMVQKENEIEFAQKIGSYEFEYYQIALENEAKIRTLYHEVANQIQVINELFEQGEKEQAKQITNELREKYSSANPIRFCNNRIVNVILSIKQKEAMSQGVMLEAQVSSIPDKMNITDLDLSMILTNLLDNAITGSLKVSDGEKKVKIKIGYISDNMVIAISNPTDIPERELTNVKIDTTKENKDNHGVGLTIIRRLVKKYNGKINLVSEKGYFVVKIVIES